MVYVTGDCHGNYNKFRTKSFPEQKEMTRDDILIICGDFGIWHKTAEEDWWLNWLNKKNFTTVFVDGNHENFDRLYGDEFKIVDFHGAKAHKIRPHIFHIMRGEVFEIEGKKFWCFGGAKCHDIRDGILDPADFSSIEDLKFTANLWYRQGKIFRINHLSWWEQELPSQEELDYGMAKLSENDNKIDYIISHCAPQEIALMMRLYDSDILTQYFNTVAHTVQFDRWYFGHYHCNKDVFGKFVCLYEKIERLI